MASYFAVRVLRGPAWQPDLPFRQQQYWEEHAAFMDALTTEGFVVLGGPLGGTEGALLVIDAADAATIKARLSVDPWSKSGHLQIGRIDAWTILLNNGKL